VACEADDPVEGEDASALLKREIIRRVLARHDGMGLDMTRQHKALKNILLFFILSLILLGCPYPYERDSIVGPSGFDGAKGAKGAKGDKGTTGETGQPGNVEKNENCQILLSVSGHETAILCPLI